MTESQKDQLKRLIAQHAAAVDTLAYWEAKDRREATPTLRNDVTRAHEAMKSFIDQM